MSETQNTPASMLTVADMLVTAESISRVEFYMTKYDNRPAELNCRCHGLPGMGKSDIEKLANELNAAIAPVLESQQWSLKSKAANQLRSFL